MRDIEKVNADHIFIFPNNKNIIVTFPIIKPRFLHYLKLSIKKFLNVGKSKFSDISLNISSS